MKEYTILALLSTIVAIVLDHWSGIRVLRRKEYYVLLAIVWVFMLGVNGYLTGMIVDAIVVYDPRFFLGLRLITIPIEDFFFGFSMITLAVVSWERFKSTARA